MSTPPRVAADALAAFEAPFALDGLILPNRWVMAPMTRRRSSQGVPPSAVGDYYVRRAAGGVGLIITEGIYLDLPTAGDDSNVPCLDPPDARMAWGEIVDRVHGEGSLIFAQLWHLGPQFGEHTQRESAVRSSSPSGIRLDGTSHHEAMSLQDIDAVIAAYARTAAAAEQAGFDGIEIHGAHGYLIDCFLWSRTNQRSDRYGGSHRARARFAAEVVAAIRAECPRLPISFRFSQWKVAHYQARIASTARDLEEVLVPIAAAGASIFHASTRRYWEPAFAGSNLTLAGWAKKLTGRPAIAVGSIGLDTALRVGHDHADASLAKLADLHERLRAGEFDLVAVGRALLANPAWTDALHSGTLQPYTPEMRARLW